MAVTTLLDQFNIARPLETQRRQLTGSFAGSVLPQPREVRNRRLPSRGSFSRWLRAVADPARDQRSSFRVLADSSPMRQSAGTRMLFASPFLLDGAGGDACSLTDHERMRAALGRCVAAVQAAHLIGEGAGHTPARGNP